MITYENTDIAASDLPVISVIIPVYNVEPYLGRCLDSVVGQTYRNLEIILVDDGSRDRSGDICDSYTSKDARIRVIHEENGGVSVARNKGLDIATGDYVAFVDSDDWVHPQYFELLAGLAVEYKADCVFCGTRSVDHRDKEIERDFAGDAVKIVATDLEAVLTNHFWRTRIWGRLYNKQLVRNIQFPVGIQWGEDTVFNLSALCFKESVTVAAVDAKLYFYFQRAESAIHTLTGEYTFRVLPIYEDMFDRCKTSRRVYIAEQIIKQGLSQRYACMLSADRKVQQEECNRLLKKCVRTEIGLPLKQYLIYKLFALSPSCYRLFRIATDRTMLEWEKNEKKKRQQSDGSI